MAQRDGAGGAAETVAEPAEPGPDVTIGDGEIGTDGESAGTAAGPQGAGAPDETDAAAPATTVDDEAAEPVVTGRRGRLSRPPGPRTPAFGLSLAAIRAPRSRAAAGDTEELRRSLAHTEAEANELREALDALRQALDDTTVAGPASQPSPPPRRRRGALLLAAGAGAAALVVVGALVLTGGDETAPSAAAPAATVSTPAPIASSPAPAASSPAPSSPAPSTSPSAVPTLTTRPMDWPGGPVTAPPGLPATGPGVDAPGTDVTFAIGDDLRSVDVYEQVYLSAPSEQVGLGLPATSSWPQALAAAEPAVEQLQVEVDGRAVTPRTASGGWFALAPSGSSATRVVLRYKLTGTIVDLGDNPQSPDRRLVAVPGLTARTSTEAGAPVRYRITDPRVQGMFCVTPQRALALCSATSAGTVSATLPADGAPLVVLQADLRAL